MTTDAKPSDNGTTRRTTSYTYFHFDGHKLEEVAYSCGPRCSGNCKECAAHCVRRKP